MGYKKIILITLGMVLLVSLITAQVLTQRTANIELSKEHKATLEEYSLNSPETTPLICFDNGDICTYKIYQDQGYKQIYGGHYLNGTIYYKQEKIIYNLGTHEINRSNKNILQIETEQEQQIKEWLGEYAEVLEQRKEKEKETILNKTKINILERAR